MEASQEDAGWLEFFLRGPDGQQALSSPIRSPGWKTLWGSYLRSTSVRSLRKNAPRQNTTFRGPLSLLVEWDA